MNCYLALRRGFNKMKKALCCSRKKPANPYRDIDASIFGSRSQTNISCHSPFLEIGPLPTSPPQFDPKVDAPTFTSFGKPVKNPYVEHAEKPIVDNSSSSFNYNSEIFGLMYNPYGDSRSCCLSGKFKNYFGRTNKSVDNDSDSGYSEKSITKELGNGNTKIKISSWDSNDESCC